MSAPAEHLLEQGEKAEVQVLVPTLVLAEITHIARKKTVKVSVDEVLERIEQGDGFAVVSFDLVIFREMLRLPDDWELHDRIIGATTRYYKAKLISKDEALDDADEIETVW